MRSGRQHFINVLEVYSTNGEPRNRDIDRRPAHIIESDWSGGGLGARGEDGTDGDVVRTSRDGALRLLRGMCAETKLDFSRATGDLRRQSETGLKKIFLPEMACVRTNP